MKTKDSIKYALTTTFREKKNFYFILILMICTVVLIGTLTFKKLFSYDLENDSYNNLLYRKLIVSPKDIHGVEYDYHYEKLYDIKHVQEIYNMRYDSIGLNVKKYKNNIYNGKIEVLYGTKNTLPKEIIGKGFEENDSGVAICAKNFYPSINSYEKINLETKFLDGKELIGTSFKIDEPIYERINGKLHESDETYSKEYKIIGVYDTSKTKDATYSCYISGEDARELYDTTSKVLNMNTLSPEIVVVDKNENIDYVITEIGKLGFRAERQIVINKSLLSNIKIISLFIVVVTIIVITLLTISYVKKKSLDDSFEIGLLKSLGFKIKDIQKISFYQIIVLIIFSFLLGCIVFEITFILLNTIFKNYLIYNNYMLKLFITPFVISMLIIIILPTLVNYLYTKKKIKDSSISLLHGEQL